jgi:hydroxyacylglutathione hydrolase
MEIRRVVVGPLDTNCWVIHSAGSAILVDPGDAPEAVLDAVRDLKVTAIVLTHVHFDHVLAADTVAEELGVPVLAHPAETATWQNELAYLAEHGHYDAGTDTEKLLAADVCLDVGMWSGRFSHVPTTLRVGSLDVEVLHTPGHSPGSITLAVPGHLFTGDTLFPGGPGLTTGPLCDFPTIIESVRGLLEYPADTIVHPGHGLDTTVEREKPALPSWIARGW